MFFCYNHFNKKSVFLMNPIKEMNQRKRSFCWSLKISKWGKLEVNWFKKYDGKLTIGSETSVQNASESNTFQIEKIQTTKDGFSESGTFGLHN